LTPLAKERLKALKEAEELGSGYKIALKDLEIRGAGNILGKEQSGNINRVGLNLYCQMLSEAIEKMKRG
jgi:transcription-repair coupling factor (superfamily II helicase)